MFCVYVLKSLKNEKMYIGYTSKSPEVRLKEHNLGSNQYTKGNRPYKLIYVEEYEDEEVAKKRELFLKTGNGRSFLKKKLIKIIGPVAQLDRATAF